MRVLNKKAIRKINLFISSLFIFLLHLPFVFAKNKPRQVQTRLAGAIKEIKATTDTLLKPVQHLVADTSDLYETLKLKTLGMARQAFDYSMKGFNKLKQSGKIADEHIISIADFSQPSTNKRLYVIDLEKKEVLFNTWVAHGKNSGQEMATNFSNTPHSNKSSLGFYTTMATYNGRNGYSLRLNGEERGFNDNALGRDIVMHAADYVNTDYIASQGWIGRSQGCPAVMPILNKPIIETIKGGTCFFIYAEQSDYLQRSALLN
jgi:hypothetical protein